MGGGESEESGESKKPSGFHRPTSKTEAMNALQEGASCTSAHGLWRKPIRPQQAGVEPYF